MTLIFHCRFRHYYADAFTLSRMIFFDGLSMPFHVSFDWRHFSATPLSP
jgi:hypothetical protein